MTPQEFAEAMQYLGDIYGKEISRGQLNAWYTFFVDDSAEVFRQAAYQIGATSKFFPSVAELREEMVKIYEPTLLLSSSDAYDQVLLAVRKHGYYNEQDAMHSLDPVAARTIRLMGGWKRFCVSDQNEWTRKEFYRLYEEEGQRRERHAMLGDINVVDMIREHEQKMLGTTGE